MFTRESGGPVANRSPKKRLPQKIAHKRIHQKPICPHTHTHTTHTRAAKEQKKNCARRSSSIKNLVVQTPGSTGTRSRGWNSATGTAKQSAGEHQYQLPVSIIIARMSMEKVANKQYET